MLCLDDVLANFYPVVELGPQLARGSDVLPKTAFHSYFRFAESATSEADGLVVSQDELDDEFAPEILRFVAGRERVLALDKVPMPANVFGFSHLLLVPAGHHSELTGRL